MKILSLGLDQTILDTSSPLAQRARLYGSLVDKYVVITPGKENKIVELSDKVSAYGLKADNKIFTLWSIFSLAKKLLQQEKFDIISVQDQYFLGSVAYLLAKKFNLGLEIQVHGFEKFYGPRKMIAKYILPKADSVRAVSQRLKNKLVQEFRVKEENIIVVPIFVATNHGLVRKDINDNKFVFLSVGRLVPVKNFSLQILAMKDIVADFPQAKLMILGSGPMEAELKQLVKDLGLEQVVEFKGWIKDLYPYYQQADTLLLTSYAEGWPLVIVEAASFALPIIMTDVGSAGDFIKDKENGLVIPINNRAALVSAMKSLLKDNVLRKELGQAAWSAALNLPSQEQILALYKQSWQKSLNRNKK
ncbi:glycosyltransferase family 1 protein [Candidatus Parcubacteria bacterium]|nr:MAG: glycosyltransferase family 1 protein [Candidatus Parcubacteria bacterium]